MIEIQEQTIRCLIDVNVNHKSTILKGQGAVPAQDFYPHLEPNQDQVSPHLSTDARIDEERKSPKKLKGPEMEQMNHYWKKIKLNLHQIDDIREESTPSLGISNSPPSVKGSPISI
jgi:hypothetical protein